MVRAINRLILAITRHWLALVNAVMALVLGLAYLAPWLMAHGAPVAGQLIYLVYRPLCHQLPERSFFLGGPRAAYVLQQLTAHLGYEAPARWIGDAQLGYKVAFCERDTAIYAGWLAAGLAFALARRGGRLPNRPYNRGRFPNRPFEGLVFALVGWWGRLPNRPNRALPWQWQAMLAFTVPMVVDGTGQLFGFWESTWWMRVITGALFAVGTVWFAFPFIERGMKDAQGTALRSLEEIDAAD